MNKYKSHKIIEAAAISLVEPVGTERSPDDILVLTGYDVHLYTGSVVNVEPDTFARSVPAPGDYLVRYPDGYVSHSPKLAFEEGYTRYDAEQEAFNQFSTPAAGVRMQCVAMANNRQGVDAPRSGSEVLKDADDFFRYIRGDAIQFEKLEVGQGADVAVEMVAMSRKEYTSLKAASGKLFGVNDALAQINELVEAATADLEGELVDRQAVVKKMFLIVQTMGDLKTYLQG